MPQHSKITITDIARQAGVSIATVSRVLNDRPGNIAISETTKARVLTAARALGYSINPFAAGLRTGRSGMIAAIVRDVSDPYLTRVTQAVEKATWAADLNILIGHAQFDDRRTKRHLDFMLGGLFDGLLLIGSMADADDLIDSLTVRKLPTVGIAIGRQEGILSVEVDEVGAAATLTRHVLSLGHSRLAFVGSLSLPGVDLRLETVRRVIEHAGHSISVSNIVDIANDRGLAARAALKLMSEKVPPTAIICSSDNLALGVMAGVQALGFSVPGDISIVGFDDIPDATHSFPALTTMRQPVDAMARAAIEALAEMIDGAETPNPAPIGAQLVVRHSSAPR